MQNVSVKEIGKGYKDHNKAVWRTFVLQHHGGQIHLLVGIPRKGIPSVQFMDVKDKWLRPLVLQLLKEEFEIPLA